MAIKVAGSVFRSKYKEKDSKELKRCEKWTMQVYYNGKQYREASGVTDKKRAETKLEDFKKRIKNAEVVEKKTGENLAEFLGQYLEVQKDGGLKATTVKRYRASKNALVAKGSPLHNLPIHKITPTLVAKYIAYRSKSVSKSNVSKEKTWLVAALAYAKAQRLIPKTAYADIVDEITPKNIPALKNANKAGTRFLLPGEFEVLLDAIKGHGNQNQI